VVDDERERILAAAWGVLRRTGYENLKMQGVATASGVSVGSLYRRFGSKEALLAEVYRQEIQRVVRVLWEKTRHGSPVQRVRTWIELMAGTGLGEGRRQAKAHWFGHLPEEVSRLATSGDDVDVSAPLRAAVTDGIRDGSFPSADVDWDVPFVLALCGRLAMGTPWWSAQDPGVATERLVRFVLGALGRPVGSEAP